MRNAKRRRPMCADRGSLGGQRGQAMTEAVVGMTVMVPLLLLTVLLGKYHAIEHAVVSASRDLVFECTVRLDDCADEDGRARLLQEMRWRHFARHDTAIESAASLPEVPGAQDRNPLWVDRSGRPLLERYAHASADVGHQRFDAGLAVSSSGAGRAAASAADLLSRLAGPGRFGLEITDGLVTSDVHADVQRSLVSGLPRSLEGLALRMRSRAAVLTDAWTATSPYGDEPRSVASRVDAGRRLDEPFESGIDTAYAPTRGFVSLMGTVGLEPSAERFRYHEIDVDLVPEDRIAP